MRQINNSTNLNLILLLSFIMLLSQSYALKYSIDFPHNIFETSDLGELWHPHLKMINIKNSYKIIDIRSSVPVSLSLLQHASENEKKSHSFLQVSTEAESTQNTPKMQCGCKFLKSNENFLKENLKALENIAGNNSNNSGGSSTTFLQFKSNTPLKNEVNTPIETIFPNLHQNTPPLEQKNFISRKKKTNIDLINLIDSDNKISFKQISRPNLNFENIQEKKADKYQEQIDILNQQINQNNSLLNKLENILEQKQISNQILSGVNNTPIQQIQAQAPQTQPMIVNPNQIPIQNTVNQPNVPYYIINNTPLQNPFNLNPIVNQPMLNNNFPINPQQNYQNTFAQYIPNNQNGAFMGLNNQYAVFNHY